MVRSSDYESIRNARIQQIQEKFDALGVKSAMLGLRSVKPKKLWVKKDYGSWPRRSSPRLNPISPYKNDVKRKRGRPRKLHLVDGNEITNAGKMTSDMKRNRGRPRKLPPLDGSAELLEDSKTKPLQTIIKGVQEQNDGLEMNEPHIEAIIECITPNDYESIRNARIQENQARLALLGVQKALSDLRSIKTSVNPVRKTKKVNYVPSPLRRSSRLKATTEHNGLLELSLESEEEWEMKYPANGSLALSPEVGERRCSSKNRGTVYHAAGITCHFCRQKTLCSEEECKHCGDLDLDKPCIGKTECSACHSSNGVLCRACLKVRYGEEMEEVRGNKHWMCPHCVEEKGTKPYWICNSSICLKKQKLAPTGIAIFKAREMGFKSVAHLLMDHLQQRNQSKMLR